MEIRLDQDDRICLNGCLIHKHLYNLLSAREEDDRLDLLYNIINMGVTAINSCTVTERVENIIHKEIKSELFDEFNNFKVQISDTISDTIGRINQLNSVKIDRIDPEKNNKIINDFINSQIENLGRGLINKMNNIENAIVEINTAKRVLKGTTGKGIVFEKKLINYLNEIAAPLNDNVIDYTSNVGFIERSKKGDFVVENFNIRNYRFVVEAKSYNETSQMDKTDVENYLDESLKNRSAQFIILVFEDEIPEKIQGIRFIGNNKLICSLDDLQNAYNTAKHYLYQKRLNDISIRIQQQSMIDKKRENIPDATRSKIRNELRNIKQDLKRIEMIQEDIERIRREYTSFSNKQLNGLKESIESFYYNISRKFNNIDNLLIYTEEQSQKDQQQEINDEQKTEEQVLDTNQPTTNTDLTYPNPISSDTHPDININPELESESVYRESSSMYKENKKIIRTSGDRYRKDQKNIEDSW